MTSHRLPVNMSLLRLQDKHVTKDVWEGNERLLRPKRHAILASLFLQYYIQNPLLPLFLISAPCIIITLFLCFSLCPSEVNLHTYLTTWLSSFPVRIFIGFPP